jgi:putative ABC transport system ATP-binding protein
VTTVGSSPARLQTGVAVHCASVHHVYQVDGNDVLALDDVDLTVRAGEGVAVLGPSGSGKSTLLTLLAGLLRPTSGRLYIGADDISAMTERDMLAFRANQIGVVVQGPGRNLLPYGTAEDNIRFAQRGVRRFRRAEGADPTDLLERLGLGALSGQVSGRMSGGEQQRLAVALAMSNSPGLLLVDEPTSQLDRPNRDRVVELLRTVTARFGTTVLAVTHDSDVASALGRTVTIERGRIDDRDQHREQYVQVRVDGSIMLPEDVRDLLPPGLTARIVRKPDGIELINETGAEPS